MYPEQCTCGSVRMGIAEGRAVYKCGSVFSASPSAWIQPCVGDTPHSLQQPRSTVVPRSEEQQTPLLAQSCARIAEEIRDAKMARGWPSTIWWAAADLTATRIRKRSQPRGDDQKETLSSEPVVSPNTRTPDEANPHPFAMDGLGTPDRPCVQCGLPDRHPVHHTGATPHAKGEFKPMEFVVPTGMSASRPTPSPALDERYVTHAVIAELRAQLEDAERSLVLCRESDLRARESIRKISDTLLDAHGKTLPSSWVYTDPFTTIELLVAEIVTLRAEQATAIEMQRNDSAQAFDLIQKAILEEREACAGVAETYNGMATVPSQVCRHIASRIRLRSKAQGTTAETKPAVE